MAKINKPPSNFHNSENELEAGIETLIREAQNGSAEVLKQIVLIASGLIDNSENISEQSLMRIGAGLSQLDKNIAASGDVMRGVNLFVESS